MSRAAEEYVATLTHPEVKGSVREFFRSIAQHIPEGQTTTPPMTLDALAAPAQQVERTARTNRDRLVALGAIKVHDGGRGRKTARYEMLPLTSGARPLTPASLPLRADLQEVKLRRGKDPGSTGDLFADADAQTSDPMFERSDRFADVWAKVGSFCRRLGAKVGSDVRKVGSFCRRLLPLDVDDARTRGTYTLKNVHTQTAAPRDGPTADEMPEAVKSPPVIERHPWHAWCDLVCVPKGLHQEFLRKGHDAAWLVAFYARTCAALSAGERITVNDFTFWRGALRAELTARVTTPAATTPRVSTRGTWCPHEPLCATRHACIDLTIADARAQAARERQTG